MLKLKKISVYIVPVLLIIFATVLKFQFTDILGSRTPFLLYTGVVIGAIWYSGWIMGLVTSLICTLIVCFYFIDPGHSFPRHVLVHVVIFTGQNLFLVSMGYHMKKALKQSRGAENRLKLLVEQACDLLVLRDESGGAIYVSPKVSEVLGYTPLEYMKLNMTDLIAPEDLDEYQKSVEDIKKEANKRCFMKIRITRKDGSICWIEGDVYNYLAQPGIHALVSHYRDITERVKLERQKDEFLSIASHELKTPVTSVKAALQMVERMVNKEPGLVLSVPLIQKANKQVNRLTGIISNLLDVTRIHAGKLELNPSKFNLYELIEECADYNISINPKSKITITGDKDLTVFADRIRIDQVLCNLISNAIKYSPDADEVKIIFKNSGDKIKVSVIDQGIGIPEDKIANVFDRFYRVEHTSQNFSGLGLGLYITSRIVKQHGGDIGVNSKVREGSEFWFTIAA